MCFYHDYDWSAEVSHRRTSVATLGEKCLECHRVMPTGAFCHRVDMQEHEECQACEHEECECAADKCCQCSSPDYGEEYSYQRCLDCDKFLEAVKEAEIAVGCSPSEALPGLEGMIEEISNGDQKEAKRYFLFAVKMFPELRTSDYLGWLWGRLWLGKTTRQAPPVPEGCP